MPTTKPARRGPAWIWIAVLAAAGAAEAVYAAGLPLPELATLIPDDSYFYLQVARWVVDHGRFAFGPGPETYGFQPLWQLIVAALAYAAPDRAALLSWTLLLCILVRTLTGIALFRLARDLWGTPAGVFASAAWAFNPAIAVWSWGLKENTLYALFLVLAAHSLATLLRAGATWRHAAWLGLWLGLAVVTRVNAAVVAALFLAVALLAPGRDPRAARLVRLVAALGIATLIPGAWYAFAYFHFGTALPTSGVWKLQIGRSLVERVWQIGWFSLEHAERALTETVVYLRRTLANGFGPLEFVLAGTAAAAVLTWPFLRREPARVGAASVAVAMVLGGFAAAFLSALTLLPYLPYAKWYTVVEYVGIALGFGWALGRAVRLFRHAAGRAALALGLVLGLLVWPADRWRAHGPWLGQLLPRDLLAHSPSTTQTLELGLWAARHVPETVTLGMFDPGAITYFSGCNVVSLDPLMNSLDYQRQGLLDPAGHTVRYCVARGISHIVGSGYEADGRWVFRGLPADTYDVLWVPFPDFPLPWSGDRPVHLMIVRLRGSEAAEFVVPSALPHGHYRPNEVQDPLAVEAASREATLTGDALRLRVAAGVRGTWSLWSDDVELASAPVDQAGWAFFDLRGLPPRQLRLRFDQQSTLPPLVSAYCVDFTFPVVD